jgi:hypothetical protein
MKKALIVGINDYPQSTNDLQGCVNDAYDWAQVLGSKFGFEYEFLLDSEATKEAILSRLHALISEATTGDVVVFTYSGHGTQVLDQGTDEPDSYDEALYVYDGLLLDDELRAVFDRLHPDATAYAVIDSCFSGTATRAIVNGKPRYVELQKIPWGASPSKRFMQEEDMVELLLSGSAEDEYAYDALINERYNGAMSYYATRILNLNTEITWENFYAKLRENLPSPNLPQTPQLEGREEVKKRKALTGKQAPVVELPSKLGYYILGGVGILLLILFVYGLFIA